MMHECFLQLRAPEKAHISEVRKILTAYAKLSLKDSLC